MTKHTVGQELVIAPNGYPNPVVLTVTKVGTKYVSAEAKNGARRTIIKATGLTEQGERVWPSLEVFEEAVSRAKRIKEIKAMIGKFEWGKCSMAKLDTIAAAFNASEQRLEAEAFLQKIGMA